MIMATVTLIISVIIVVTVLPAGSAMCVFISDDLVLNSIWMSVFGWT